MADQIRPGLWRAAAAVVVRTLKIKTRYSTWFLPYLIWPILAPFAFVFMARALAGPNNEALQSFARLSGTADFTTFVVIGITFWNWFNWMLWDMGSSFRLEQVHGTMESNWLAPVPKIFLAVGAFAVQVGFGLATTALSFLSVYVVWRLTFAGSIGGLLVVLLVSVPSIYGTGLIFASLVLLAKEIGSFVFFVRGVMTVFCGVAYPIAALPGWMQAFSRILPLSHSIEAVRIIAAGGGLCDIHSHLRFLAISGGLLLITGFGCFEWLRGYLVRTGTLGHY